VFHAILFEKITFVLHTRSRNNRKKKNLSSFFVSRQGTKGECFRLFISSSTSLSEGEVRSRDPALSERLNDLN